MKLLPALCCVLLITQIHAKIHQRFNQIYADTNLQLESSDDGVTVDKPLILTSYLQKGKIKEAQKAALVQNKKFLGVVSYSGYFTVDDRFDSNLWFWFFPSTSPEGSSDPVVLWLNGGPGASSLNGLFDEHGPFVVDKNGKVSLRHYSWNKNHSILYIDNPVGVGFSFTNGGLALNDTKVGEDMHSGLTQFFQLFPNLQNNDFFISGQSYADKYLSAIGYTILKKNPKAIVRINLQGILIGNGWTDPIHQLNYAPYVYNIGLVTEALAKEIKVNTKKAINDIKEGDAVNASIHWNNILTLISTNARVSIYNYVKKYDNSSAWPEFITTKEIRKALHVGKTKFGDKGAGLALYNDQYESVSPWLETLLEKYRVLFYTGQFDIICGYPLVLDYLKLLKFPGAEQFRKANRTVFQVNSEAAGYARTGGKLTELLVRDAGHLVPRDQPRWASEMLFRFTRNYIFDSTFD